MDVSHGCATGCGSAGCLGAPPLVRAAATFALAALAAFFVALPFMFALAVMTWRKLTHGAPATRFEPRAFRPRDESVSANQPDVRARWGRSRSTCDSTDTVIGGGAAGIAARQMLARSRSTLFERADDVGGLWNYDDPRASRCSTASSRTSPNATTDSRGHDGATHLVAAVRRAHARVPPIVREKTQPHAPRSNASRGDVVRASTDGPHATVASSGQHEKTLAATPPVVPMLEPRRRVAERPPSSLASRVRFEPTTRTAAANRHLRRRRRPRDRRDRRDRGRVRRRVRVHAAQFSTQERPRFGNGVRDASRTRPSTASPRTSPARASSSSARAPLPARTSRRTCAAAPRASRSRFEPNAGLFRGATSPVGPRGYCAPPRACPRG